MMESTKEFRKQVLQAHYDISGGNTLKSVMRTLVAEKFGLENYNNDGLLGTIKYLEDKGYLKVSTNMEDQITDLGIDEVEKEFPNLYPVVDFRAKEATKEKNEEVLKLSPEFYGVGINLKAIWRKFKTQIKK